MSRTDARRIALAALRRLLSAQPPSEISVAGRTVSLTTSRAPGVAWPDIEGLMEAKDGPWPVPLQIRATWEDGGVDLGVSCEFWQTRDKYRHCLGIRVYLVDPRQVILWSTVETKVAAAAAAGEQPIVSAEFTVRRRKSDGDIAPLVLQLQSLVNESGLPKCSESDVELFRIRLPDGAMEPSPDIALARLVQIVLLKLPFLMRGGQLPASMLPFAIDVGSPDDPELKVGKDFRSSILVLPGTVTEYKKTLDDVLVWLAEPRTRSDLDQMWRDRYGARDRRVYQYNLLLRKLGLVRIDDETVSLSDFGKAYLESRDPSVLFQRLTSRFTGLLEALVVAAEKNHTLPGELHRLLVTVLEVDWGSPGQTSRRYYWLESLGLITSEGRRIAVTELGRQALEDHAEEVEEIRLRLGSRATEDSVPDDFDSDESDEIEQLMRPSNVALSAADVTVHLDTLRLPPLVLEQACAALSCGKHLLLVGPPGTGKTELAVAIGKAAEEGNYCSGLRPSTATSDWSTFETIGGYSLEPVAGGSRLDFRPGVFLQALEADEWLLVDELNRADVDRAFGELMTVLSGRGVVLPYANKDGRSVSMGTPGDESEPVTGWTHPIRPTFRLIATMNSWDKSSLFKLSYALQRRFAILHVDVPSEDTYRELIRESALRSGDDRPLAESDAARIANLFGRAEGILAYRRIGPAIALDLVRYVRRRVADGASPGDACAEGIALFLLPQLEGLDPKAARRVNDTIELALRDWALPAAIRLFRERWSDLLLDAPSSTELSA